MARSDTIRYVEDKTRIEGFGTDCKHMGIENPEEPKALSDFPIPSVYNLYQNRVWLSVLSDL